MSIYNKRNAAVGYITLKAASRALKRRRQRRNGLKLGLYIGLGLVSVGILAAVAVIAVRRQEGRPPMRPEEDLRRPTRSARTRRDRRRVRPRRRSIPATASIDDRPTRIGRRFDQRSQARPVQAGKPVEEVREARSRARRQARFEQKAYGPFRLLQGDRARHARDLNRYPDGGAWRLGHALADLHGVGFENVTVCAGADAVIGLWPARR